MQTVSNKLQSNAYNTYKEVNSLPFLLLLLLFVFLFIFHVLSLSLPTMDSATNISNEHPASPFPLTCFSPFSLLSFSCSPSDWVAQWDADVLLTFDNAMLYNPADNAIHQLAIKVRKFFEAEKELHRASLKVHRLSFLPPPASTFFLISIILHLLSSLSSTSPYILQLFDLESEASKGSAQAGGNLSKELVPESPTSSVGPSSSCSESESSSSPPPLPLLSVLASPSFPLPPSSAFAAPFSPA